MYKDRMSDCIETERLVLFPYTKDDLALFNSDLAAFEERFGVVYRGEELDHLLSDFLKKLEEEIAADPKHYLFFTEFFHKKKDARCQRSKLTTMNFAFSLDFFSCLRQKKPSHFGGS